MYGLWEMESGERRPDSLLDGSNHFDDRVTRRLLLNVVPTRLTILLLVYLMCTPPAALPSLDCEEVRANLKNPYQKNLSGFPLYVSRLLLLVGG
jgi:hypothetical protein